MRIRFDSEHEVGFNSRAVFLDLPQATRDAQMGRIVEVQRGSAAEPAVALRLSAPPPLGSIIDVPISLSAEPYGGHSSLNRKLRLHGVVDALRPFGVRRIETRTDGRGTEAAIRVRLI